MSEGSRWGHGPRTLDALEMAIRSRRDEDLAGLVHHSDRGVQYLSIRYAERLVDAGADTSVGHAATATTVRLGWPPGRPDSSLGSAQQ